MPYRKPIRKSRKMNIMQTNSLSYQKRKYTAVYDIVQQPGALTENFVVSHISSNNVQSVADQDTGTFNLGSTDVDGQVFADMTLNQQFKITGVMYKLMFSQKTESPVPIQWELAYSPDVVINSQVPSANV